MSVDESLVVARRGPRRDRNAPETRGTPGGIPRSFWKPAPWAPSI